MLEYATTYNGERIAEDPKLQPPEKETSINFSPAAGLAMINTHQGAIMRALLQCDFFDVLEVEKRNGVVVGVTGRIPIGSLSIKPPRATNAISRVISQAARGKSVAQ